MSEDYLPPSDFLHACIEGDVTLSGSRFADANLARLIAMTRDEDVANRDWATLLLAQTELDTPAIRAALEERLGDADSIVRGEALVGLAERDPVATLPLVVVALDAEQASVPLFEAAAMLGDRSLLPLLLPWRNEASHPPDAIDDALDVAIAACGGEPPG